MNSLKKLTPTLLYLLLLIVIAILFFISINDSKIISPDTSINNTNPPTITDDNLDYTSKDEPTDELLPDQNPPTPPEEIKPTYSDTIPRQPLASETHLYTQRIYGDESVVLRKVLNTSKGIFAILSSTAKVGDVCGDLPSIGIVLMDVAGNLQKAISLSYTYTHQYVTSQVVSDGIIIISTSENNDHLYVNKISIDLNEISTYRIPYAPRAEIVNTTTSFLIFTYYPNETIVYKQLESSFSFQSINCGNVVEMFDYNSYFLIFCNNVSSNTFSIVKLNANNLAVTYESSTINSQIVSVTPIVENGTQNFILLSKQNNMLTATKYDSKLNIALISKNLGYSNASKVLSSENKLLFFSQGNVSGVVALNYDLSTNLSQSDAYNALEQVFDVNYHAGTFYCLGLSKTNELIMVRTIDNVTTIEYYATSTNYAEFCVNPNGTLTVFCQYGNEVTIIGTQQ